MESCSQLYTRKIVDSIIHGLEQKHSSILFVKHYNTLSVPVEAIQKAIDKSSSDIVMLYHEFSASRMQEAYEPFLGWIKQLYFKFYYNMPVGEFLEKADVYYLSRSAIESYIMTGECHRTEDIIVIEVDYEQKQFADSLAKIFSFISNEHTLLLVLNRLHLAENSTLNFLLKFIQKKYDCISLLANYNEAYVGPAYTMSKWSALVHEIEDFNYMLDWNIQDIQTENALPESFEPNVASFKNYLSLINNMIQTVAVKQAMYYLKIIYNKLIIEKVSLSAKSRAKFYILYALASIYDRNNTTALMMCDKLKHVNLKYPNAKYDFQYYYMLTLAEINGGQQNLARKNCRKCMEIALKNHSETQQFKARLIYYVCELEGWNNFYRWDKNLEGEELDEFIKEAIKYQNYNHLAHILFFGCGNRKENFIDDDETHRCEEQEMFQKAMALAKMLKNDRLIISAWRKNVFMAQGYGCFGFVDYYYKKCLEIIEQQKDIGEEATVYNGLGFNRIVSEQFLRANEYFNKALNLFFNQKDAYYVAETLYNMATNAILADNFEKAYNYLIYCLKLLKSIKENRMKICNISKIYGMVVYCSYKMGIEYNAHFYLNKMERVLYHLIYPDGEPSYFLWDDDMFFYYFVKGLLEKSDSIESAQECFDKAFFHLMRTEGLQFFAYELFAVEQADLYELQNEHDKAVEILERCIEFCNQRGYKHKEEILFARLHNQPVLTKYMELPLTSVDKYQIEELAQLAEMQMMLAERTKGLDFLVAWQELLNKENNTRHDIIDNSMVMLQNNYNIDSIIYVEMVAQKPVMQYNSGNHQIDDDTLEKLADYFTRHKKEFVASRFEREFYEYSLILSVYGINRVLSFACVPLSEGDELTGFMMASIDLHENMTGNIIFLDRNDLTIFKFALKQMTDTIYRIKARDEINQMNRKLQQSAVTDLLTGLYNRQGFSKNIDDYAKLVENGKKEDIGLTILYIDLDNFKFCNDTFGHAVGDAILIAFSRLFERIAGENDYCVRYGGDEFLIVMPERSIEDGIKAAKKIYSEIERCNNFIPEIEKAVRGQKIEIPENHRVSCSIGIASADSYNQEAVNIALKHADTRLYDVKKNQKSNYSVWKDD